MATEPDAPKTEDESPESEPTEKEIAARREELGVDDDLVAKLPDIAVRHVQGTATEAEQAIMENLAAGKPVPGSKAEETQKKRKAEEQEQEVAAESVPETPPERPGRKPRRLASSARHQSDRQAYLLRRAPPAKATHG